MSRDFVDSTQHLAGLQPPDGASRVDAARADEVWVHFVPIEGSQRGTEVRVLVVVQNTLE